MPQTFRQSTLCLLILLFGAAAGFGESSDSAALPAAPPADPRAARLFAKAVKEHSDGKLGPALEDFRKADQTARGHCLSCEWKALALAQQDRQVGDGKIEEELAHLLDQASASSPKSVAQR